MEDKSYHELINECSRDLCLQSDTCKADCHGLNCENSWHAECLIKAGWIKQQTGTWKLYSSTMMECSNCKKHVPYHRYKYCPHCGSKNEMEKYNG